MVNKKCIFHMPNYIDLKSKSGSSVHPLNMIAGFKENGYIVECITGYGEQRKKQIRIIEQNIKNGDKYDFLFSESSSMPTLLTEKNHIPKYLNLDFGFWKFCKMHQIPIGLFYADVQWKFDFYKSSVPWYKRAVSVPMYRYDLHKYKELVDIFYLPSKAMKVYIKEQKYLLQKARILMPGCNSNDIFLDRKKKFYYDKVFISNLNIFYVGGVSRIYDLSVFLKAIRPLTNVYLTICCRTNEWDEIESKYRAYMTKNINIVHESGEALEKYYEEADLCCGIAGQGSYMSMAMPVKIFEYLGHAIPILSTQDTEAGNYVKENDVGWSISYDECSIRECLKEILENPQILVKKHEQMCKAIPENTWKMRAEQVTNELLNLGV